MPIVRISVNGLTDILVQPLGDHIPCKCAQRIIKVLAQHSPTNYAVSFQFFFHPLARAECLLPDWQAGEERTLD